MINKKTFAIGEVKDVATENPAGEFEVILSAETLDRDGEIIDAKAFEPLPASIPFHAFHDFHDPIGRGVPFYDGDILKARGTFASTPRAQEIRTLVAEGVIGHTSVGFMAAVRKGKGDDDTPHVTNGELLEGSFVSVPSNREAAVLMAKEFDAQADAKATKSDRIQTIHDMAVANGAACTTATREAPQVSTEEAPVSPAPDGAGKSPASADVVAAARIRARAALLAIGELPTIKQHSAHERGRSE